MYWWSIIRVLGNRPDSNNITNMYNYRNIPQETTLNSDIIVHVEGVTLEYFICIFLIMPIGVIVAPMTTLASSIILILHSRYCVKKAKEDERVLWSPWAIRVMTMICYYLNLDEYRKY